MHVNTTWYLEFNADDGSVFFVLFLFSHSVQRKALKRKKQNVNNLKYVLSFAQLQKTAKNHIENEKKIKIKKSKRENWPTHSGKIQEYILIEWKI